MVVQEKGETLFMEKKTASAIMLTLLLTSMLTLAFKIQPAKAEGGTIYIRADGSIQPSTAPIFSVDNVTYTLTDNIAGNVPDYSSAIVIERDNIVLNGAGYTLQGTGASGSKGIELSGRANVTVQITQIKNFYHGIWLISSSYNTVSGNNITNNGYGIYLGYSSNNRFYHNNLIDNTQQVCIYTTGYANVWDDSYPFCGNYWSNYYNGTDSRSGPFQNETGADGVGDTPCVIDSNDKDGYPLMSPWTANFTIFNHMVVGCSSGPLTLDPACAYDAASLELITNVYETLIAFDEEKTDEFVPRLATDWYISPDGLTYTFRIRQGVKFHNGEILTVEDVEYSLERVLVIDYYGGPSWMLYEALLNLTASRDWQGNFTVTGQQIDNAVTRNDTCVALHLIRPYPPLMQILASPCSSIVCKKWCTQIGDWPGTWNNWTLYNRPYKTAIENQTTEPPGPHINAMCGTGPFMFDYYQAGVEWHLVRFDYYWGGWPVSGSAGSLKRVTGKIVSDWETRKNMFLDGELDTLQVPQTGFDEVYGQPGVQCIYPLQCFQCEALFFTFNISTSSPFMGVPGGLPPGTLNQSGIPPNFFSDINVRKGFAYAFNYTELIAEALGGKASQPATPIIPGLPYYNPAQEKYTCNLTKAIQYFSSAWSGQLWSNGFNLTVCYNVGNVVRQKACEIMKANVESLNPKFHIQIQPLWGGYFNDAEQHLLPIFEIVWLADFPDPDNFAEAFMYSVSPYGTFAPFQSYSNSTIDSLVEQGIGTMNETARRQIYYQLQSVYHDDCPSVPTYQPLGYRFQRDWVQGWHSNTLNDECPSIDYFYSEWKGNTSASSRYSWDMFRHDAAHTGYTESPAPNGVLTWKYATGSYVVSSPAVAGGVVYVGSADGKVYALNATTGTQVWNFTTGGRIEWSSPAVTGGVVYVGSTDGKVYALNATTGTQVWSCTTGSAVYSSPAVAGGVVYVGSDDNKVYALNATTGAQAWNYTTGDCVWSSPAVADGVVYVGSDDNKVYALNATTGAEIWNFTTFSWAESSPAVAGGTVFVGSWDGNVYALNATTGAQAWSYGTGSSVFSSPAVADGVVYVGSMDRKIYAFGKQVYVYRNHPIEPAPMGIADYGIGPSGPYEYATKSFVGIVTIASLSTYSSLNETATTFQLNVNLAFNTSYGQYVYWIQDVVFIDTSSLRVAFIDNVWNSSATRANMSASGVSGNGQVEFVNFGSYNQSFYYDWANKSLPYNDILTYPTTITFNVTSGINSYGEPTVSFAYDDGYGLITYDTVTFTNVTGLTSLTGFEVNGFNYNPAGLFYDSELILGGGGDGVSTIDVQSDVRLQLEYWNGRNYQNVPNAYNFGSDTAEKIDNVTSAFSYYPGNGTIFAKILSGAGQLGELYNQFQTGAIDIISPLASGTLYVTNASYPNATAWQIPFVSGKVTVTLYPGYYDLQLYNQYGELFDQGNFTVSAGQILYLQAPFSRPATHNIAAISAVSAKTVIGKGFSDNVTVLVADKGDYAETFNVTTYANSTVIGTKQVSLNATDQTTLTFTLNSSDFDKGNYTISAFAEPVSGETDTADNTCNDGWVKVTIPGDVTGEGTCNMLDIQIMINKFMASPPDPRYDPNVDVNNDGSINMVEIQIAINNFLKPDPP
jgi:peptide/nickel transport system substrate-binding protein